MISGTSRYQPGVGARDDRDQHGDADREQREPDADDRRRAPRRRPACPASSATANMLSDSGAIERPGLHRVVLEHHLQEDRQRDHRAAERDLLEHLPGDPEPEQLRAEQVGVEQRRLALRACAAPATTPAPASADHADRDAARRPTRRPPATRGCRARCRPCRATERTAPTTSTPAVAGVRHVADEPDARQHDRDDDGLEQERDPPRQVGGDEAAEQRADGGGDRRRRADQGVDPASAPRPRSCRG